MYAKLEVILYIPDDKYNELKAQGTPERDIQKNIEKSVTLRKYPGDVANDIVSVSLLDYEGE